MKSLASQRIQDYIALKSNAQFSLCLTPDPIPPFRLLHRHLLMCQRNWIRAQVWPRSRFPLTWLLFYTCCKQATLCILTQYLSFPDDPCFTASYTDHLDTGSSFILKPCSFYQLQLYSITSPFSNAFLHHFTNCKSIFLYSLTCSS